MKQADLVQCLKKALQRYATEPYQRVASLEETIVEESGTPSDFPDADYCQIQFEVLDRWNEGKVEVLHVAVTAGDGFQTLGGDLYFRSDGTVKTGSEIYKFIDGVPHAITE